MKSPISIANYNAVGGPTLSIQVITQDFIHQISKQKIDNIGSNWLFDYEDLEIL